MFPSLGGRASTYGAAAPLNTIPTKKESFKSKYESYVTKKVDPFFSKLLQSVYKDTPEDIVSYTKVYIDAQVSSTPSEGDDNYNNDEFEDEEEDKRRNMHSSSERAATSSIGGDKTNIENQILKRDLVDAKKESLELKTSYDSLKSENSRLLAEIKSLKGNRSVISVAAEKRKRGDGATVLVPLKKGDSFGGLNRKGAKNAAISPNSGAAAGDKLSEKKRILASLKALREEASSSDSYSSLSVEQIDALMDFALRSANESETVNVQFDSMPDIKSFEKIELDAFKSYVMTNFTTNALPEQKTEVLGHRRKVLSFEGMDVGEESEEETHSSHSSEALSPFLKNAQIDTIVKLASIHAHEEVPKFLLNFEEWNFDIFDIADKMENPLIFVAYNAVQKDDLCRKVKLDLEVFMHFTFEVQNQYISSNPYHNALHAADVTHATTWFLFKGRLSTLIDQEMQFAMILSAIIHDVGHPALNNPFLINTHNELARRYNDQSCLENFHVCKAFEIMKSSPKLDVLAKFPKSSHNRIRTACISNVLGTDNAYHSKILGKLTTKLDAGSLNMSEWNDTLLVMKLVLHAADVSNPSKDMLLYKRWTDLIMAEFFAQGDQERDLNLPVSPGYDRTAPIPTAKMQAGFIHALCLPLYRAVGEIPGLDITFCVSQLENNLASWHKDISRRSSTTTPPPPIPAGRISH
jgi:hypothetical protein